MFRTTLPVLFLVAQAVEIWSNPMGAPPQHQTPDPSISKQTRLKNSDLVVTTETVPVSEEIDRKVKDYLNFQTKDMNQVTEKYKDEITTHESDKKIPVREPKLSPKRLPNFKELLAQARQKFLSQTNKKTAITSNQLPRKRTDNILEKSSEEQILRSRHSLLSRLRKLSRTLSSLENPNIPSVNIANNSTYNPSRQDNTNVTTTNKVFIVADAKIKDLTNEEISEQQESSVEISIDGVSRTTVTAGNNNLVTDLGYTRPKFGIRPQEYFRQQKIGVESPALQSKLTELVRNVSIPLKPQGRSLSKVSPTNEIQQNIANGSKNSMPNLHLNLNKVNKTTQPLSVVITEKTTESIDGQYDEINQGHYHEINPGQYHELNPGQYNEFNPGQYHEINPGQYTEVNPGQVELQVEVDESESIKTYNVHKKSGDYIIGEVGKIDIKNGKTFEGVRYTAIDGILDQKKISELLQHYFGTQTSR